MSCCERMTPNPTLQRTVEQHCAAVVRALSFCVNGPLWVDSSRRRRDVKLCRIDRPPLVSPPRTSNQDAPFSIYLARYLRSSYAPVARRSAVLGIRTDRDDGAG